MHAKHIQRRLHNIVRICLRYDYVHEHKPAADSVCIEVCFLRRQTDQHAFSLQGGRLGDRYCIADLMAFGLLTDHAMKP